MQQPSYQTVRLGKGKHSSPEHGVCVMELASMLAGEPFTDHPRSASRSIAAFLRGYNDMLDDERRQDLYEYAAKVIGSSGSEEVERARRERLVAWGDEMWNRRVMGSVRAYFRRPDSRFRWRRDPEAAAHHALHAVRRVSDDVHARVLSLVDDLIAIGSPDGDAGRPAIPSTAREMPSFV